MSYKKIKKWVKNNKKKALAIVLGVAVTGVAIGAELMFRNKYNGTASTSRDGRKILKYIVSGSNKKLDLNKVSLRSGNRVIYNKGSGRGRGITQLPCGGVYAQRIKGFSLI